ncbi:hypothetical protein F5X97DRAFT_295653 [Nemania serpens]|nr:hypothetical protein F5X97DRAFT_295653 [Nemania serpens]
MISINHNPDNLDAGEKGIVNEIAERLGHLPLVLDHIGSYTRRTATTYRTFKQFYQDFDKKLLFQAGMVGPS